eukprot:9942896-Ditylum_brightwellii.AAC.1
MDDLHPEIDPSDHDALTKLEQQRTSLKKELREITRHKMLGIFDICLALSQLIAMSFMTSKGNIYDNPSGSKDCFSSFIAYNKSTMVKNDTIATKNATVFATIMKVQTKVTTFQNIYQKRVVESNSTHDENVSRLNDENSEENETEDNIGEDQPKGSNEENQPKYNNRENHPTDNNEEDQPKDNKKENHSTITTAEQVVNMVRESTTSKITKKIPAHENKHLQGMI